MRLFIDYDNISRYALVSPLEKDEWHWNVIVSTLYDKTVGLRQNGDTLLIPINRFVEISNLLARYAVNHEIKIQLTPSISTFLKRFMTV